MPCRCESINPGMTDRPCRSITLEPGPASLVVLRAFRFDERNPFLKRAAGLGFELGDPFLDHGHPGMDVIEKGGIGGGLGH